MRDKHWCRNRDETNCVGFFIIFLENLCVHISYLFHSVEEVQNCEGNKEQLAHHVAW